jgi:DHA2 family methylenomycin A resistance protein-like MFS transporter
MKPGRVRSAGLLHVLPHAAASAPGGTRPGVVLATGCLALFLLGVNTTAINAALPAMARDLGVGTGTLSWAVNVYMLAVATLVVLGGRLGDMFGQRAAGLVGLGVFAAGAVLVALAADGTLLVAGRLVQGLGATLVMPATTAVLRLAYPPEKQGFAQGVWGAVGGSAFALGPLIGGLLTDELSWRWVWWGSAVWALAVAALAHVTLRTLPGREPWAGFDAAGTVLLGVPLFALVLAFQQVPAWGAGSAAVVTAFAGAVVGLVALVVVESRRAAPLLHLRLLRRPALVAACVGTGVNTLFLIGLLYFFNLYAQAAATLDYSAVAASVALLPYGACVFATSLASGPLCDRVGFRLPVALGMLCCSGGAFWLAQVDGASRYGGLWPGTVVLGLGVGLTLSAPSAAGLRALPPANAGEGAGIINVVRYLTAALVVSAGTLVFLTEGGRRLNDHLDRAGVARQDDARIDGLLTGVGERLDAVEPGLGSTARHAVREGAAAGLAHGFASVMLGLAVLTLVGAVAWTLLLRTRPRG